MNKPVIRLLVTDLDNTLYDWVGFFAKAFRAMVDEAVKVIGVDREVLLDELQAVHRRHHESERPWSLLETPAVLARWPNKSVDERRQQLDDAFHAFNRVRLEHLHLYPGVAETLLEIHALGVPIVAHTEASTIAAVTRLRKLQLERVLDQVYAADVGDNIASGPLNVVPVRREIHKPDPRILLDICAMYGVQPHDALYVGDSIARDIGMARQAGMRSAWAKYGTNHDPADWRQLVRVTHWTAEDVARVEDAQRRFGDCKPDVVLHENYAEVLEHFEFQSQEFRVEVSA